MCKTVFISAVVVLVLMVAMTIFGLYLKSAVATIMGYIMTHAFVVVAVDEFKESKAQHEERYHRKPTEQEERLDMYINMYQMGRISEKQFVDVVKSVCTTKQD